MNLMCMVGLHKWVVDPPVFTDQLELDLNLPTVQGTRCCSKCPKKQVMDTIEVNMYTGDIVSSWKTIS